MSLRPVTKSRKNYRAKRQWRRSRPIDRKKWVSHWDWQDATNAWHGWDPSKHKRSLTALIFLSLTLVMYGWSLDPGNAIFHNYTVQPIYPSGTVNSVSALEDSCNKFHVPTTCATVASGSQDPTYPINKWTGASGTLADFNTGGGAAFTTSCASWGTTNCVQLSATAGPPPVAGMFTLPAGSISITSATINPQTPSMRYKRATGISSNSTFFFDVTGAQVQAGTWLITTTGTTTVTFAGTQPNPVTCPGCASTSYVGAEEILVFGPGLSSSSFSLTWPTGSNPNFLGGMVESTTTIGDLSPVVAKELEFAVYMQPTGNPTICTVNYNCGWGMFLTTNATLWKTNNATFNPYNDPSVALFFLFYITTNGGGVQKVNWILFVQTNPGQSIVSQDTKACTEGGSAYLCSNGNQNLVTNGDAAYFDLNYTGGAAGSQVGNGVNCPLLAGGGNGCTYALVTDNINAAGTVVEATTPITPKLPLSASNYYLGFWLGSGELGSPMLFCYDSGAKCSAQQTEVTNGCVSASMELDSCVPTPIGASGNGANPVTDSGGFFGSAWRSLTSIGSSVASFTQPIWGPIASAGANALGSLYNDFVSAMEAVGSYVVNTALPQLEGLLTGILNTIGNLIFPNSNIGTILANFLNSIVAFFTNDVPTLASNIPTAITNFLNWIQIIFPFIGPAFAIAKAILAVGVNGIGQGITITILATQALLATYGTLLFVLFFIFVGSDGINGVRGFFGTMQAITFWIINLIVLLFNLALDLVLDGIGLIPKPFVQMHINKIPNLPTLETTASMHFPAFDLAEARNGNLIVYFFWSLGFYMFTWYETRNPALPGSMVALNPAIAANIRLAAGLLPLLQAITLISGGLVIAWLAMLPMQLAGIDVRESPFGVGLGRFAGSPGAVSFGKGKARLRFGAARGPKGAKGPGTGKTNIKRFAKLGIAEKEKEAPIN